MVFISSELDIISSSSRYNFFLFNRKSIPDWIWLLRIEKKWKETLQTVEFTTDTTPLSTLTSDGLPVTLEISFQYQLNQDTVYELYMDLGDNWPLIFNAVGQHILSEGNRAFCDAYHWRFQKKKKSVATRFTANQFFSDQEGIGSVMKLTLNTEYSSKFYSTVSQFQLKSVSLPVDFEAAIQNTIVASQNIQQANYLLQTAQVSLSFLYFSTQHLHSFFLWKKKKSARLMQIRPSFKPHTMPISQLFPRKQLPRTPSRLPTLKLMLTTT